METPLPAPVLEPLPALLPSSFARAGPTRAGGWSSAAGGRAWNPGWQYALCRGLAIRRTSDGVMCAGLRRLRL